MSASLLECRALAKEYRVGAARVPALRGVDLSLERGEILAIVGESGSGKTTLGSLVLGIERPDSGEIRLDGVPLPSSRPRVLRRRLQLVPQNPLSALNPKHTIFQSVALPLAVHRLVPRSERASRVAQLLAAVGLSPEYMQRHPRVLSGGQRQRVALARALAAEPDIIVLDEPTSALDVSVQARILALLAQLQQEHHLSYLFITHDLGVVRALAHRVVVLYRGRIVESGPTDRVFISPLHRYTQMLLASVPVVSAAEARSKPHWPKSAEEQGGDAADAGCSFRRRCPFAVDACSAAEPAMIEHAPGHAARCINPHGRTLPASVGSVP